MISSGTNLVMTVIGFAVSAMFIVFVCTRLICARIQLSASRRSFPAASGSDLSILERGLHGLDPGLVAAFPTNKFSDHLFSSGSGRDAQCTICLSEYQDKDVLRVLPYCGHAFHVTCIDIWLKQHSTCPVCRISLRNSPDRKHIMQPVYSATIRTPQEAFELDAYHSPQVGHEYSSRTIENQMMESIQSDALITESAGALEMASTEVNSSTKIICHYDAEEK